MDDILLNVGGKEFYFDIDQLANQVQYDIEKVQHYGTISHTLRSYIRSVFVEFEQHRTDIDI